MNIFSISTFVYFLSILLQSENSEANIECLILFSENKNDLTIYLMFLSVNLFH